jgi:hypothetical protein
MHNYLLFSAEPGCNMNLQSIGFRRMYLLYWKIKETSVLRESLRKHININYYYEEGLVLLKGKNLKHGSNGSCL